MNIELAGQKLELLPQRAVWWPEQSTLLIADVHLGKDQVFRRSGIPIPNAVLEAELAALDDLLALRPARRLIVLGDLIHAPPQPDDAWPDRVASWRDQHRSVQMTLVPGNHDCGNKSRFDPVHSTCPESWGIDESGDSIKINGLKLVHEIDMNNLQPGMSGHIHPRLWVGSGADRTKLSAFACRGQHLILPAFGRFTGGFDGLDRKQWTWYPIGGDQVFELPGR